MQNRVRWAAKTNRRNRVVAQCSRAAVRVGLLLLVTCFVVGCDDLLTETPPAGDDFETPFDGLPMAFNAHFDRGDENFEKVFTVETGLGPIFNNAGCVNCHPGDGRGTPAEALIRFSRGADLAFDIGGPQFQSRSIPGVPLEVLPPGVDKSTRLPPPVFGVGLIEAIPVDTILAIADPNDADRDGVSGRPNWVLPSAYVPPSEVGSGPGMQIGRFGRKASVSSLLQQVVEAYHEDMGVTSDFIPIENSHPQMGGSAIGDLVADPEISSATVFDTVVYVRLLAPPARGAVTPEVERGDAVFTEIGCASCHVPTMRTGPNILPQLSGVDANLYSDLLLHDMGSELADNRPDGSATGTEWRTAPLWGTRLVEDFLGGTPFYLHDGRATTLMDAILPHGGEATRSRERFVGLSGADQAALLAFVKSL